MIETGDSTCCNICGGTHFEAGPNGRLSRRKSPPRCSGCRSLERHRQLRQVYARLGAEWLNAMKVLQLSPDIGVDPSWFRSYEVSEYLGSNHLDLENIARGDDSYDLVICNHVLEHVADDRKGFAELLRIAGPGGLVQVTVPSPYTQSTTVDWGFPRDDAHGHYRGYGRDIVQRLQAGSPEASILEIETFDPVTGDGGYVYLCCQSATLFDELASQFEGAAAHRPAA